MQSSVLNNLEIKGTLQENPFVELLREFTEARLSGSFRLSHQMHKVIVYLRNGHIVFAVSNQRQHRLFEVLLSSHRITKEQLVEIPDFANDMALGEALAAKEIISKNEIDAIFSYQIKDILRTVFKWEAGEWIFSPLARIKDSIRFNIDCVKLIIEHARELSTTSIIKRFKSFEETFGVNVDNAPNLNLLPQEAYLLSRFEESLMRVRDIKNAAGLSDAETLQYLYVLWLANFISRRNWNSVLSPTKIREILSARLSVVKEAAPVKEEVKPVIPAPIQTEALPSVTPEDAEPIEIDEKQLVADYLKRVEGAESYYEMLEIEMKASLPEIKNAYFKLAKNFHPDKYHQEADTALQQRIQNAFTEIARAYETLKDNDKRETYDYRLRKYFETAGTTAKVTASQQTNISQADRANEEFESGFNYLLNEDYEEAVLSLTRAVHMAANNAKYHAYLGKALSFDDKQRHKAESEIQTAIKLDSGNTTFRIMLIELYIQFNLMRRAEGELQRFLTAYPDNREALVLRETLKQQK